MDAATLPSGSTTGLDDGEITLCADVDDAKKGCDGFGDKAKRVFRINRRGKRSAREHGVEFGKTVSGDVPIDLCPMHSEERGKGVCVMRMFRDECGDENVCVEVNLQGRPILPMRASRSSSTREDHATCGEFFP